MAILTCERCGTQTAKLSPCSYCQKKDCFACIKSSRRKTKQQKLFICKSCWSALGTRRQFKQSGDIGMHRREEES